FKGDVGVMHEYDRPRCVQRLDEQSIAGGSAERRRAGMVEAMVDPDGRRAGLMDRRDELRQDGPVEDRSETLFAVRITDNNAQRVAGRDRSSNPQPGVI